MELRESRAQAAIARKEKNAAATKTAELKQALASVTKQNKVNARVLATRHALAHVMLSAIRTKTAFNANGPV